jgi:MYXO-CTERM domain-containing protein
VARCGRLLALAGLVGGLGLRAQTAISTINLDWVTGTATTVTADNQTVTYDNDQEQVYSFKTTTGVTYYTADEAQTALIQRDPTKDTYAPNELSVWYASTGTGTSLTYLAPDSTNANSVLLGNNLYRGSDNLLTNDNGNTQSSDDVERLDFILKTSGESATTDQAFAVFDRGNPTNHDTFKIAVITGIDTNGNPTSYGGNLITVTASNYDTSANPIANQNYTVERYDTGDNLSAQDNNIETQTSTGSPLTIATTDESSQGVGGVVLSLANLGIAPGTTIYGYSIMAADVFTTGTASVAINGAVSADLVNYMNTTYYPTNTSDNTTTGDGSYGGIDLAAVNGVEFSSIAPTPEPSVYGAVLAALALGVFALRRRRRLTSA